MNAAMQTEFNEFWKCYPHRVAKLAAMKAYEKARKQATAAQLLDGIAAYRRHKPAWQAWAYASSWLNAGRWLDDYDAPAVPIARELPDWYAEQYAAAEKRETERAKVDASAPPHGERI